ncbi:hypothetical protein BDV39DRAFT_207815 [Aspergillus sergii]|uniref:Uncharacterized protein n=1 Tax=Aspergillus sergii TaxID=1034303 RepID=A0A5N6WYZ6_9EURO|nr:hypothetical protein BDV39DRAFT_207815 [Aspergillus sergii]
MSSGDSSGDGEASSEDDEKGQIHFEQLQTVIPFLTSGPSEDLLKSNIYLLIHPPTSIPDAIQLSGIRNLSKLLEEQFKKVVVDEYAWIKGLREIGYSYYEIADFLCQAKFDAPWIYFEPGLRKLKNCVVLLELSLLLAIPIN